MAEVQDLCLHLSIHCIMLVCGFSCICVFTCSTYMLLMCHKPAEASAMQSSDHTAILEQSRALKIVMSIDSVLKDYMKRERSNFAFTLTLGSDAQVKHFQYFLYPCVSLNLF